MTDAMRLKMFLESKEMMEMRQRLRRIRGLNQACKDCFEEGVMRLPQEERDRLFGEKGER